MGLWLLILIHFILTGFTAGWASATYTCAPGLAGRPDPHSGLQICVTWTSKCQSGSKEREMGKNQRRPKQEFSLSRNPSTTLSIHNPPYGPWGLRLSSLCSSQSQQYTYLSVPCSLGQSWHRQFTVATSPVSKQSLHQLDKLDQFPGPNALFQLHLPVSGLNSALILPSQWKIQTPPKKNDTELLLTFPEFYSPGGVNQEEGKSRGTAPPPGRIQEVQAFQGPA